MKVGTLNRWRTQPVNMPVRMAIRKQTATASRITGSMGKPLPVNFSVTTASRQPWKAMAEPTLRSISPEMMTKVMPKAMMPVVEALRRMFRKLSQVAKPWAKKARKPMMTRRMISSAKALIWIPVF